MDSLSWKLLSNKERFQIKDINVSMGYDFYRSNGEMIDDDPIYKYPFYNDESNILVFSTISESIETTSGQKSFMVTDVLDKNEWDLLMNNYENIF